jgi:hypothetical protein
MGQDDIAALIAVLQQQQALGREGVALGTWEIKFNRVKGTFTFDKCENEGYCEERPAVVALDGTVVDPGGPLFGG